MREIKFRAWHESAGWMIEFVEIQLKARSFFVEGIAPDDIVLMQYTGLKDKNGVEIYEGDIIEWTREIDGRIITFTAKVFFVDGNGWFKANGMDQGSAVLSSEIETTKVIGNIYQNPELLTNN